jgi:hypothetical protein
MPDAPSPAPDIQPSSPPRKANWKRTIGCIALLLAPFTIAPPGCLFWYFAIFEAKAIRDAKRGADWVLEALAKDAEGGNEFHAWAIQVGRIGEPFGESEFDWWWIRQRGRETEGFRFKSSTSAEEKMHEKNPLVLPTPLPAVMDETPFRQMRVTRSTEPGKPRTAIWIWNWDRVSVSLCLTDEYLDNDPPPASAFRNATSTPGSNFGEPSKYSTTVDVAPGFRIHHGYSPR